jgi:hypothetical protein
MLPAKMRGSTKCSNQNIQPFAFNRERPITAHNAFQL